MEVGALQKETQLHWKEVAHAVRLFDLGDDLAFHQAPEAEVDIARVLGNIQLSRSDTQNLSPLGRNNFYSIRRSLVKNSRTILDVEDQ